jgi:shikimate kinase
VRIYLTGFMGAGKSTVGRLLAARLEVPFVDLDAEIEAEAARPVAEIFAADGEPSFRRREREALRGTSDLERCVVATGGGAPVAPDNRAWMRAHGRVVWLDVPWDRLLERLGSGEGRPLWNDPSSLADLHRSRLPAYRDCDLRVDAGDRTPEALAADIARDLFR